MEGKFVYYNGNTESYLNCSDPKVLKIGQKYEILSKDVHDWQTNYTLKGVEGEFNSVWFSTSPIPKTFIAVSHHIPVVGKSLHCYKVQSENLECHLISTHTTTVIEVQQLGNNLYRATTRNSVYYVQIPAIPE